jgi:hypothetical protein
MIVRIMKALLGGHSRQRVLQMGIMQCDISQQTDRIEK